MFWFCMSAWAVALIRLKFRSIVSNIFYLVSCTGYRQKALRSCYLSIDLGPGSRHFVVSSDPVVESLSRLVPVNLLEFQAVITASSNLNASPQRLRRSGMSATERVGGSIPQPLQSACQSTLGLHPCECVYQCKYQSVYLLHILSTGSLHHMSFMMHPLKGFACPSCLKVGLCVRWKCKSLQCR